MEKSEIIHAPSAELATAHPSQTLAVVLQAVRDPSIDPARMRELLEIAERLEAKEAKRQFDEAFRSAQSSLPTITKRGLIVYKPGSKGTAFAKWDDIHRACMPVLNEHGFSVSFTSELQGQTALKVTCRVKHVAGHEESGSITVPWLDAGGAKSPAQQAASSETLAQRHAFVKFFNILTEDQDDDGSGKGIQQRITDEQCLEIEDYLSRFPQDRQTKFRALMKGWFGTDVISELFENQYAEAVTKLKAALKSLDKQ